MREIELMTRLLRNSVAQYITANGRDLALLGNTAVSPLYRPVNLSKFPRLYPTTSHQCS